MSSIEIDRKILFKTQSLSQKERLFELLTRSDLDFHDQESLYASHNFHSFPAKFPPQLPRLFIENLTQPGDLVLDPMQGSGTTVVETSLSGRRALGFDIDPLANLIAQVKTTILKSEEVFEAGIDIKKRACGLAKNRDPKIFHEMERLWDSETHNFVDYWFDIDVQIELIALLLEIRRIPDHEIRRFFMLALSSCIITKTGGVSLALDLAHTRPHRAKLVYSSNGEIIEGDDLLKNPPKNIVHMTKTIRSPLEEFEKRIRNNAKGLLQVNSSFYPVDLVFGNAQYLPLNSNSIDLIVTSPPYASNAIDYMRAHKFSLVWLGYPIKELSDKRKDYIGAEDTSRFNFELLPDRVEDTILEISKADRNKGQVIRRYYSEMTRAISEMYRVLKPGKCAVVVGGNSEMRGKSTSTQDCLAEIGKNTGFEVAAIGIRRLDRDRRMLPAGSKVDRKSQIQKRMHEEYVIGFYKPTK